MKYVNKSVKYYSDRLAASTPVPGGGSVAALLGVLGCGLLSMVANFTIAKKGYNGYKERAKKALRESERLRAKLTDLVDKDIQAYERLSKAFKRHKGDVNKVQAYLKKAVTPALKLCSYVHKAALLSLELAYVGNKPLLPDVDIAIHVLDGAFESALTNINVNSRLIRDKKYVSDKAYIYNRQYQDMKKIKAEVLSRIRLRIFGESGKHQHEGEDFIQES